VPLRCLTSLRSEICVLCSETVNGAVKHKQVSDTHGGLKRERGYRPRGLESTYREEGKQEGRNRMLLHFFRKFFLFFLLGISYIGPLAGYLLSIILISEKADCL
jgi:hypothetical protein